MSDLDSDLDSVPSSTEGLAEAEFLARYDFAVLVVGTEEEAKSAEFSTLTATPAELLAATQGAPSPRRLIRVAKRGLNPFASMITIGRAKNNDIYVAHKDISKFHAYLSQKPGGGWQITDAGSTNGTFQRGVQLAARLPSDVEVGETLVLGTTEFVLLQGASLYHYLRARE